MVQYIKYARYDDPSVRPVEFGVPENAWGPWELTVEFPKEFELTEIGKKVYAIGYRHPDKDRAEKEKASSGGGGSGGFLDNCVML